MKYIILILALMNCLNINAQKKRARDLGIIIGILALGRKLKQSV